MCSVPPNSERITAKISDQEFFRARNIDIPMLAGVKEKLLNRYDYLKSPPVWRTVLKCNCEVIGKHDVCGHDKTVYLSRGVGGDESFFVHVVNSSKLLTVIAHVCFK